MKAGLIKHKKGHYDLRTHSLRKFFKTQMIALGCQSDYVDYFMGHVLDTYHSIQSIGLERLRSAYSVAGLSIRTKVKMSEVDQVKQLIRALGGDPNKWLSKEMLSDGAITVQNVEDQQLGMLRERLRQLILTQKTV